MSDDREFWRATTDWLEAGIDRTPPAAIDAVLLAVRTTRQDRALPIPWQPFRVPLVVRIAIVAALLATLAFLTITYVGGHRQAPTTDTTTPPLEVPVTDQVALLSAGQRYVTGDPFPVRITLQSPAGWEGHVGGPYAVWLGVASGDEPVMFNTSIWPYLDPCHPDQGTVAQPSPATVADVVDALDTLPGVDVTDRAATIGGRPAVMLTATAPPSTANCGNQVFSLWQLPLGAVVALPSGATQRIWVVDIGAKGPLVIGAQDDVAWPASLRATIEQLLDSFQIEPSS